ncbi:hypothetical protein WN48_03526, partial [Eufriesea mexicana]
EFDYFDTVIDKSLLEMSKIHDGLIVLKDSNAILRKDYVNLIGKVSNLTYKILMQNMDCCDLESQGPVMNHETGQAFLSVISMACEAIMTCTKLLDKIGEEYGNRDYDLQNALNRNVDPIDAFGIAVKAAENFTTSVLYTQTFHKFKFPNPQAHAIGIWMRAAYEGTKLKLMYCNTK